MIRVVAARVAAVPKSAPSVRAKKNAHHQEEGEPEARKFDSPFTFTTITQRIMALAEL